MLKDLIFIDENQANFVSKLLRIKSKMFQDILPHTLNIDFQKPTPENDDYLIVCSNNEMLIHNNEEFTFPSIADVQHHNINTDLLIYLFDMDRKKFFLSTNTLPETDNFTYQNVNTLRNRQPQWLCFCAATAMHLAKWYENNQFCGKCGSRMMPDETERMLRCAECGQMVYPRINPVVIVGITDGDHLLLGKNSNSQYQGYGLISGFMEVGETLEDTVNREVMEEVGLRVKNIRYYKSQPWAFSESILVGFFAEVDGNKDPVLDGKELTEAIWVNREELPEGDSHFSLTWNMIEKFRVGEI